jgi:hypothetical protein
VCYSKAQGGLRCPSATVPRISAATEALRAAKDALRAAQTAHAPDDVTSPLEQTVLDKKYEMAQAWSEYAAHPTGQAAVEQSLAALEDSDPRAAYYRRVLRQAGDLRSRAKAVRDASARSKERAQARRQTLATGVPENPRVGASADFMVQGFTATQLVTLNDLQPGHPVTVTSGRMTHTGVYRGRQRGGLNNRGVLLVERADGRVVQIDANNITDVQKDQPATAAAPTCQFCSNPATHYEALMLSSGGQGNPILRCDAHTRESLVPNMMSGNMNAWAARYAS